MSVTVRIPDQCCIFDDVEFVYLAVVVERREDRPLRIGVRFAGLNDFECFASDDGDLVAAG
jgi:hypothetical protein